MQVQDIMTTNVACCMPDTKLNQVARLMVEHDCGAIPVTDGDGRMVGMITDRDIVCRAVANDCDICAVSASEYMTAEVVSARPEMDVNQVCSMMEERMIRRMPVVDENGCCCGMVSQADLALKMQGQVEELVKQVSQPSGHASAM